MHSILLGLGRCGQRMSITILQEVLNDLSLRGLPFCRLLLQKQRVRAITLADISDQPLLSKRDLEKLERIWKTNIYTVRLRETGGGGVGGKWWESEEITRKEGAKKIITLLSRKAHLQVIDTVFLVHSAGGGTGAGSGPVIAEYLLKYFKETEGGASRVFTASALALPHEEDPMRRLNALSTIGRYDGLVDTVILFDNKRWRLVMDILGKRKTEEIHDNVILINKIFARIFLWLNSTDGNISVFQRGLRHDVEPKDYEASDFKSIVRVNNETSISVPFYGEYDPTELYKYKIAYLAIYSILQNQLVPVNFENHFDNLLLIICIPIDLMKKKKIPDLEVTGLAKTIKKYLKIRGRVEVVRVYYARGNKIVITGLIINPEIQRLRELMGYIDEDLKKFDSEAQMYYNEALSKFKDFIGRIRSSNI